MTQQIQEWENYECQGSTQQPKEEDTASGETYIQGPIREVTSAESGMNKVCVIAGAKSRLFPTWAGQVPPEVRRQWGGCVEQALWIISSAGFISTQVSVVRPFSGDRYLEKTKARKTYFLP